MRTQPFSFLSLDAVCALPKPEWLLDGLVTAGGFAQLYGPPGSGKTFLALHWALCIATGLDWMPGRPVLPGNVIYVAGEGVPGFARRVNAWLQANDVPLDHPGLKNIAFVPEAVQLGDKGEVGQFIQEAAARCDGAIRLVVVDTLARATVGVDENAAKEMGRVVFEADRIRRETGSALLPVHHSGYEAQRGRGSSALPGALDTIMGLVSPFSDGAILRCDKQKDAEPFEDIRVKLRPVADSLAVEFARDILPVFVLSDNDRKAMAALEAAGPAGLRYKEWQTASGVPGSSFDRVREKLRARGTVLSVGERYVMNSALNGSTPTPTTLPDDSHGTATASLPPLPHPYGGGRVGVRSAAEGGVR